MKRLLLTLCLLLALALPKPAEARDIYVRLSSGGTFSVASDHSMTLTAEGHSFSLGKSASLTLKGGKVTVGKYAFSLPARVTSPSLLRFNKKRYRGSFLLTQKGGLLNVLDIEHYLRGVLPAEVGSDWPDEALRAQAIISRTYALRQSLSRAKKGYDVVDTVADQVYQGAGVEAAKTDKAVSSTAQKVLAYGRELAFTPFHSDSGGYTASNAHVWGTEVPYLTGVPEAIAYTSPVSSWSARISQAKVEQAVMKLTGVNIGPVTAIRVSEVDKGGRAVKLTFTGSKGSKTVNASQFRTAVGASLLKSTMLKPSASAASKAAGSVSISPTKPQTSAQAPARISSSRGESPASQEIRNLYDQIFNGGKKSQNPAQPPTVSIPRMPQPNPAPVTPVPSPSPVTSSGFSIAKAGNDFVFYGKGWGHGVGLSQWGALALAKNGWNAERILTHYYPGTTVRSYQ